MNQTSYILYRVQEYVNHGVEQINKTAPDVIIDCVCEYYNVQYDDLRVRSRRLHILRPRQVLIYLLRKYGRLTFYDIGKMFYRDHSTAITTCQVVENDREHIPDMDKAITTIERKIRTIQNAINVQKLQS